MKMDNVAKKDDSMVNIISKKTEDGNVSICLKDSQYYYLPFNKAPVDFTDDKVRTTFIKAVERRVRRSKLYKAYIDYLKTDLKLVKCAVLGNIEGDKKSKTKIEMHHGPVFTLYDIVNIVLTKHLADNSKDLNTFDIAAEVLDLHRRKLVQTVMLCESVHKSMDNGKIAPFISLDQTFGDLFGFVEEYHEYFSPKDVSALKKYIDNYKYNINHNSVNAFKPILTKHDIVFVDKGKIGDQE